jgi:hypothetical protein
MDKTRAQVDAAQHGIHVVQTFLKECAEPQAVPGRHDWFYYTSTKCAIPDDMAGQQRFWGALVTSAQH